MTGIVQAIFPARQIFTLLIEGDRRTPLVATVRRHRRWTRAILRTSRYHPHFQVPLTDRFNYAALDCSARVHVAHRSAKSSSSILSSKRDRYMLSPCTSKEKQFVIVELCDDVRIDTVQLANFEFFSGVFKDFTVSVAKTYTTREEGWTIAGTYRAKNVRGVQVSHHLSSSLLRLTFASPFIHLRRFMISIGISG